MKVLIACEYSGIVREAFKARGHDAWSCDLLDTEIPGQHIKGDVLEILDNGWDLMVAHPPCTYISNAGAGCMYPKGILNKERLELGLEAKKFFLQLLNAKIPKICVENPVPIKVVGLPNYNQIIEPYYFGHKFRKKTCLWLRNLPRLNGSMETLHKNPESTKTAKWYNTGGKERQKRRARFWPGIAKAMATQWG